MPAAEELGPLPSLPSLSGASGGQTPDAAQGATPSAHTPAGSTRTGDTRTPSNAARRASDLFRTPIAGITPHRSTGDMNRRADLGYYRPMPQITMSSPLPQVSRAASGCHAVMKHALGPQSHRPLRTP